MRRVEELLKEKIPIGVLSNTHGLEGDMKFYLFSNVPSLVNKLTEAIAYNNQQKKFVIVRFEKVRKAHEYYIVHLSGVNTVAEAERLKGFVVYVDKSFFPKSRDGEYYFFELFGAEVYDESNVNLGVVDDIIETGSNDVLVVKKGKEELLVPVIERYIVRIDKEHKKIIIRVPEWME